MRLGFSAIVGLLLVVALLATACAPVGGAAAGAGLAGAGVNPLIAASVGLVVFGVIHFIERLADQSSRAAGTTTCTYRDHYQDGRIVRDILDCSSWMQRPGFRGDPLPLPPIPPTVRNQPGSVTREPYALSSPTVVPPGVPVPQMAPQPLSPGAAAVMPPGYAPPVLDDPTKIRLENRSRRATITVSAPGYPPIELAPGASALVHLDLGDHRIVATGWVPTHFGPRPIQPRAQRISVRASGYPQTLSFSE